MQEKYDYKQIISEVKEKLARYYGCELSEATPDQCYGAIAMTVRDQIMSQYVACRSLRHKKKARRVYYLSAEFLMGRALNNNILALMRTEEYRKAMKEMGMEPELVFDEERDPGLGNGGLGRLAACFLDSLATLDYPAMGCSIRYEYGLFRQRIVDGTQVEMPDSWLEDGNVWEVAQANETYEVHFGGQVREVWENGRKRYVVDNSSTVLAKSYDIPVVGYNNTSVIPLRLWQAVAPSRLDMEKFNSGDYNRAMEERNLAEIISKVLYPEDNHIEGKELRLKQHYFLVSASMKYIVHSYKKHYGSDLSRMAESVVVHINDTHPALAIPELLRILIDEEGLEFQTALSVVRRVFAYTNHTVLSEALEKWPEELISTTLPRIYMLLKDLNEIWCRRLWEFFPGQWDRIGSMAIVGYGYVHMAALCCAYAFNVNGVSQLHAEILRKDTFRDFYTVEPHKYIGITNGITHRRWLMAANEELTDLISSAIGTQWKKEPERLEELMPFTQDAAFCEELFRVKHQKKEQFAAWLKRRQDVEIDPDTIFDVQAKRLHEYKRQLLNAIHIMALYNRIDRDSSFTMPPRTFIFSGKAAPGYVRAKLIIRYIHAVKELVERHPRASKMIRVVFVENYDVTTAEHMIPAADLSEQLSTAGKEASGTGNMKFMMNGALTIGTMDGANIEIYDRVGPENIYIFGLRVDDVNGYYASGQYRSHELYETNPELRQILQQMIDGTMVPEQPRLFSDLYQTLLFGDGGMADSYFVLRDFVDYSQKQARISAEYGTKEWMQKSAVNIAKSGYFSSDRTIEEYNRYIWHLHRLHDNG